MVIPVNIKIFIVLPSVLHKLQEKIVHKQNNHVIGCLSGTSVHHVLLRQ
jgi:hypothetical protein